MDSSQLIPAGGKITAYAIYNHSDGGRPARDDLIAHATWVVAWRVLHTPGGQETVEPIVFDDDGCHMLLVEMPDGSLADPYGSIPRHTSLEAALLGYRDALQEAWDVSHKLA